MQTILQYIGLCTKILSNRRFSRILTAATECHKNEDLLNMGKRTCSSCIYMYIYNNNFTCPIRMDTYSEFCMFACTRTLSHSSLVSFPSVSLLTALRYCFLISELLFSSFFLLLFIKNQLIPTSMSLLWRCLQLLAWFFFVRRTIGQAFGNLSILW